MDAMDENDELQKIKEYYSVKEVAEILNVSDKMVYSYIENKRLDAVKAADVLLIPVGDVEKFQFKGAGRPRTSVPAWHRAKKENTQFALFIEIRIRAGQEWQFETRLEEIRQSKAFTFPGTVARYIVMSHDDPQLVEIMLIWKKSIMPGESEREQELEDFRHALDDIFDWSTVRYKSGQVVMHT